MPKGPGVYDDLATVCLEQSQASAVIVIVLGGTRGSGFAVQTHDIGFAHRLPALLRGMADEIELSLENGNKTTEVR